ncbi:MAG: 3,4-dihydroxyphenylacetate 2,3-dioxygenase, partial [Bryobacteraceae bacterium]
VIERGPGRHGVSNAFFVYLRDPDGHRIELYSCDYYTGDPDHKPIRWSVTDRRCRSFWGTRAPDSWYEESSPVLGPDGEPVATKRANIDECDQRSEVLA